MVGIKFKQKDVIGGFYKGHRLCKIYKGMKLVSDFCGGGGEELWEGCDDGFDYNSYPPYSVLISTNSDSPKWDCHVYGDYSNYNGGTGSDGLDHGLFRVEPNWNRHLVTLTDYVGSGVIEGCHKMFDNIGNITEIIFVGEWPKPIKSIQMAFEMNPLEFLDLTQLTFADDIWYSNCLDYYGDNFTCKVTERQKEFIDNTSNHNDRPMSYFFNAASFIYCGQQYPDEPDIPETLLNLPIKWETNNTGSDYLQFYYNNSGYSMSYGEYEQYRDIAVFLKALHGIDISEGDSISLGSFAYYANNTTSIDFLDGDWDKVYISTMYQAFYRRTLITHIGGLEKLNMSKCTSLNLTFGNTESLLTLDGYQNWNFPSNCDLYGTFTRTGLVDLDLSGWADNGATMGMYFMDVNPNLESLNVCGWVSNKIDITQWDEHPKLNKIYCSDDVLQTLKQYWTDVNWDNVKHNGCYAPYSIIYSTNDLSSPRDKVNVNGFSRTGDELNRNVTDELKTIDRDEITSLSSFVGSVTNLTKIEFVGNWDMPNLTNISYMFEGCTNLETIENLEILNFSKVTRMQNMFADTPKLAEIDMSKWRVNKNETIDIGYMFQHNTIDFLDFTAFNGATLTGNSVFQDAHVSRIRCYQSFKDWCYEQYNRTNNFFTYIDEVEWEIVN